MAAVHAVAGEAAVADCGGLVFDFGLTVGQLDHPVEGICSIKASKASWGYAFRHQGVASFLDGCRGAGEVFRCGLFCQVRQLFDAVTEDDVLMQLVLEHGDVAEYF